METALTKPSDRPTDQDRQDLKDAGRLGFGIYKYGQGYWVRVMTAVFAGMIVLAGAMWAWNRLAAVSIPVAEYILPVARPSGTASLGQEVTLRRGTDAIGVAKIASVNSDGSILHLKELNLNKGKSLLDTDRVETAAGFAGAAGRPEPVYLFQRVYLQAGVAILIIIMGGIVIYRYVAVKRTSADFLIATDGEMKKVNWSTRKTIIDSTSVVISATFLIAAFIFFFDTLLSRFFMLIDVIKT